MKYLTIDEKKWLSARFPKTRIDEKEKGFTLEGELVVDMFYSETGDAGYVIFPDKEVHSSDRYIYDIYQIRVEYCDTYFIPLVYETAGRINAFAKHRNISLPDLHVNPHGDLCLCPKPLERVELNATYTIQDFFSRLLIPFFYAQSFFEKYNRWPWKDYSHGDLGIVECFAAHISKVKDKRAFIERTINSLNSKNQKSIRLASQITRQSLCFCDSGLKFRKCHREAWEAAKIFKKYINGSTV